MLLFTNNANATIASPLALDVAATTITLVDDGAVLLFHPWIRSLTGKVQLATLTHPTMPGQHEIVKITDVSGLTLTVQREYEGTMSAWPAGSTLSARVTAKTLERFLQLNDEGKIEGLSEARGIAYGQAANLGPAARDSDSIALFGNSRVADSIQFSGFPTLQLTRTDGPKGGDINLSFASVGGTDPVDLGQAATWDEFEKRRGSVVVPTIPNGFQYWPDIRSVSDESISSPTEPAFTNASPVVLADVVWNATPIPVVVTTTRFYSLVVTEVGFIAHVKTATTAPSVSIGTLADNTRFANNVALSQITGSGHIHRIPITSGGALVSKDRLQFSVDTAATGGRFLGRFYWRGFIVETDPNL